MFFDLPPQNNDPKYFYVQTGPAVIALSTRSDYTFCPTGSAMLVYQNLDRYDQPKVSTLIYNGSPISRDLVAWLNQQPAVRGAFFISFTGCVKAKDGKDGGIIMTTLRWNAERKHEEARFLVSGTGVRELASHE